MKLNKNKVMKKLNTQINKNLDIHNPSNHSSAIKYSRSPHKKTNISSSRKKPPLVKNYGSSSGVKMLRYPSNISSQRNTSTNPKSSVKKIILPTKGKSNSLKRTDNNSTKSVSEIGE